MDHVFTSFKSHTRTHTHIMKCLNSALLSRSFYHLYSRDWALGSKPALPWHTDCNPQPPWQGGVATWLHPAQGNMCHWCAWPTTFRIYLPSLFPSAGWMSTGTATLEAVSRGRRGLYQPRPGTGWRRQWAAPGPLYRTYGYIPAAPTRLSFMDTCIRNWFSISSLLVFLKILS